MGGLTPGQQPIPFLFPQVAPPHVREFMCASGHPSTIQALFTCLTNSLVLGMDSEKVLLKVALKNFWAPHSQLRPRNGAQNLVGTAIAHMEVSPGRRQRLQGGGCLKSAGPRAGAPLPLSKKGHHHLVHRPLRHCHSHKQVHSCFRLYLLWGWVGILGFQGSNCGWRELAGCPGQEGTRDPGGAQGRRRRAGAWGAGVSRRFTRSRAPSTPSGGSSGPVSWSAARRRRRGAATASVSAIPVRIRPNKYLQ